MPQQRAEGQEIQLLGTHAPRCPLSVASAHSRIRSSPDANSVSTEMLGQEVPAPPPVPLPFSPNLWDLTVLLPRDRIVS